MYTNDNLILATSTVAPLAANGVLAALVDTTSSSNVAQTVASIVATLPPPTGTNNAAGLMHRVNNTGSGSLTIAGVSIGANTFGDFAWNGSAWTAQAGSAALASDFWRSGAGAVNLPDGTLDTTENIRRDGNIGLSIDPLSTLDVAGSFATRVVVNSSAAAFSVTAAMHDIEIAEVVLAGSVVLPSAITAPGRQYIVHMAPSNTASVVTITSLAGQIESVGGALSSNIVLSHPALRSVTVKSDGTNWSMVGYVTGDNRSPALEPEPWSRGTIRIGDAIITGALVVSNGYNIASASGTGPAADARATINFTTPVPSAAYLVLGQLRSVNPANWNADNDVTWITVSTSTTGFTIATHESVSALQDLFFDFRIVPIAPTAAAPTAASTKYVGGNAANSASVTLGNFIIRQNTASTSLEIATVAGTEAIQHFSEAVNGGAFTNVSGPMTVTTAFQVLGKPTVIAGLESRRIYFGPTAIGDPRQFELTMQSISAGKIALKIVQW